MFERRVVSAFVALVSQEAQGAAARDRLDGATVFAPTLLHYQLANTAWKKVRRQPADAAKILGALTFALGDASSIVWKEVEPADVVLVAEVTGLTAYNASYIPRCTTRVGSTPRASATPAWP